MQKDTVLYTRSRSPWPRTIARSCSSSVACNRYSHCVYYRTVKVVENSSLEFLCNARNKSVQAAFGGGEQKENKTRPDRQCSVSCPTAKACSEDRVQEAMLVC